SASPYGHRAPRTAHGRRAASAAASAAAGAAAPAPADATRPAPWSPPRGVPQRRATPTLDCPGGAGGTPGPRPLFSDEVTRNYREKRELLRDRRHIDRPGRRVLAKDRGAEEAAERREDGADEQPEEQGDDLAEDHVDHRRLRVVAIHRLA